MNKSNLPMEAELKGEGKWQKLTSNKFLRIMFGALVGAGIGYSYWTFIGCNSGTCPLTSTPFKTVGIFTFMGIVWFYKK